MGSVRKLEFKDGDDGNGTDFAESVVIKPVENGYLVTLTFDGEDCEYVYLDKKEMMLDISKHL